jgi:hypothetical protein
MPVPSGVDEDGKASSAKRQVRLAGKVASVAPLAPQDEVEQRPSPASSGSVSLVLTRAIMLLRALELVKLSRKEPR